MTKTTRGQYIPTSSIDNTRPPLDMGFGAIGTGRPITNNNRAGVYTQSPCIMAGGSDHNLGSHFQSYGGPVPHTNGMHWPFLPYSMNYTGHSLHTGTQNLNEIRQAHYYTRPPPGFNQPTLYRSNSQGFTAPETIDSLSNTLDQVQITPAGAPSPITSNLWSSNAETQHPTSPLPVRSALSPSHTNGFADSSKQATSMDSYSDSDSEPDDHETHPNKYPVEIEEHYSKACNYRRQPTRSGPKIKHRTMTTHDPITLEPRTEAHQIKYYQKDMVRICRCGRFQQMDGALQHGRSNDCDGYEIHYSQKCKWKAYDDYKTGKRVLIRLCKCYKPSL